MPDQKQPAPIQPDPIECSPLIANIEKMLDVSDPVILEDQVMLIHGYSMRMLVNLYQRLDAKIDEHMKADSMQMAHALARMLDEKLSDLKRYTYTNYNELNQWQSKSLKVLVRLRKTLRGKGR